jgi:rRNA maturation endonuclease Nob1
MLNDTNDVQDPDEMCMHCGSLIDSNYRICPVCGQVWYLEDENEETKECLPEGGGRLPRREP